MQLLFIHYSFIIHDHIHQGKKSHLGRLDCGYLLYAALHTVPCLLSFLGSLAGSSSVIHGVHLRHLYHPNLISSHLISSRLILFCPVLCRLIFSHKGRKKIK